MEFIAIVKEKSEKRVLSGQQGEITMVDVVLQGGGDEIICTAFDKEAEKVSNTNYTNCIVKANIAFSMREKDGRKFQSARLERLSVMCNYSTPI